MAHPQQQAFLAYVKRKHPGYFRSSKILEIGSLDINGNLNHLFEGTYNFTGVDVGEGKNVTHVCKGHEFDADSEFDLVISSECFEHDKHYKKTIRNCVRLTRSSGLFTFTCATTGRPEHGTRATDIASSPLTCHHDSSSDVVEDNEWGFYYHNVTIKDLMEAIDVEDVFSDFLIQRRHQDLYFWGIKK